MHLLFESLGLLEATGDIDQHLETARANGATGIRFFCICTWGRENPYVPFLKIGEWEARPELYPGQIYPFYDLSQWNPAYWDKLDGILYKLKSLGMSAWPVLHDRCSWQYPNVKYFYPFYSNIQKFPTMDKDYKVASGSWGFNLWPYHCEYFCMMKLHLDYSSVDYYLELMNEYAMDFNATADPYPDEPDRTYNQSGDSIALYMHKRMAYYLMRIGVPKERLVTSTMYEGSLAGKFAAQVGLYSMHGVVSLAGFAEKLAMVNDAGLDHSKVIMSGDP